MSNYDIRSELGIYKLTERVQMNETNWLQHVERMEDYRFLKCTLDYKPVGRRHTGSPRKKCKDS
jgi:hypothetical protein